jgi:tRNA(fMet)-specific endonuclease VapC
MLLDSDHVSLLQSGVSSEARRLLARLERDAPGPIACSIITYEEQTRGWLARIAQAKTIASQVEGCRRLARHVEFYRNVDIVGFDERAAVKWQALRKAGVRIGTLDLRIAAIALVRGETLLTRNSIDFERVPGLQFEDWTR